MKKPSSIITLTTDFGYTDEYVGVMKGVILSRLPSATIVDLTHAIAVQNVAQAAFVLEASYRYFPNGAIHVIVVDPGVGSDRRLICLKAAKALFLAPDNGVLTPLLTPSLFESAVRIEAPEYYHNPVSSTFHGRDILAPVAAELACGLDPERLGPPVSLPSLKRALWEEPVLIPEQKRLRGMILFTDHFGNCITNIRETLLNELLASDGMETVTVSVCGHHINGISRVYADAAPGALLAIFGSRGYLEIAVRNGSAVGMLTPRLTMEVIISLPC